MDAGLLGLDDGRWLLSVPGTWVLPRSRRCCIGRRMCGAGTNGVYAFHEGSSGPEK